MKTLLPRNSVSDLYNKLRFREPFKVEKKSVQGVPKSCNHLIVIPLLPPKWEKFFFLFLPTYSQHIYLTTLKVSARSEAI